MEILNHYCLKYVGKLTNKNWLCKSNKSAGSKKFPRSTIYMIDLTSHCCLSAVEPVHLFCHCRCNEFSLLMEVSAAVVRITQLEKIRSFLFIYLNALSSFYSNKHLHRAIRKFSKKCFNDWKLIISQFPRIITK